MIEQRYYTFFNEFSEEYVESIYYKIDLSKIENKYKIVKWETEHGIPRSFDLSVFVENLKQDIDQYYITDNKGNVLSSVFYKGMLDKYHTGIENYSIDIDGIEFAKMSIKEMMFHDIIQEMNKKIEEDK